MNTATYTQIHIHFVCVVKYRKALIADEWREELHKFISGIVTNRGHKILQINSRPDHIHILIGLRPSDSVSGIMQIVKSESTKWINERMKLEVPFAWQAGYGAFSHSSSAVPTVIDYIANQEEHHRKENFREEYKSILETENVDYQEKYLFHDPS